MNKKMIKLMLLGLLGLLVTSSISSINAADTKEIKTIKLPTIVVTPDAFPTDIKNTTDTTQVYTAEQLDSLGVENLEQALNLFAPISFGDAGGVTSVFMRGMSSGQYKFLIDGIELKDTLSTNGAPYISGVLIDDIERIEVVGGTKSVFYGSEAIAGVIHIITKKRTGLAIDVNKGDRQYKAAISGGVVKYGYRLNSSYNHASDKSLSRLSNTEERDLNETTNIAFTVGKDFGKIDAEISLRTHLLYQDLDATFSKVDDPNYSGSSKQDLSLIKLEAPIGENANTSLRYSRTSLVRRTLNNVDSLDAVNSENTIYEGSIDKVEFRNQVRVNKYWNMGFGADAKTTTGRYTDTRDFGFGNSTSKIDQQQQSMYGAYIQEAWSYKLFSLKAGGRLEGYSKDQTINTYSFTASQFVPDIDINIIFNYKTGYREPTLYERFNVFSGVKDLEAETSISRELTVEKQVKAAKFTATYFENDVDNLITTISEFDPGVPVFGAEYINSSELSRSIGGELGVSIKPIGKMQFLNITWAKTRARNGMARSLKVPEERVTAATAFRCGKLTWGASVNYLGSQRADYTSYLDPYTVVNTNFSYKLTPKSSTYVGLYNLGNTQYEVVKSFSAADRTIRVGYKHTL
ncbi:hypothetical protein DID80_07625 [Candidatus Marinamargulisbacteria bacterium SCGC AAA071-K20]|nr:hypothetical protein DID80_07625 [Candidatus Marinamargulisbacteria bacterium SCGC AAA071-K20]